MRRARPGSGVATCLRLVLCRHLGGLVLCRHLSSAHKQGGAALIPPIGRDTSAAACLLLARLACSSTAPAKPWTSTCDDVPERLLRLAHTC